MANVDLVMRLLAEDKASDKFKKVGNSAKATQDRFASLKRTAAGLAATGAVLAFAKSSVTKFAEVEDATSALQATYGKTADSFTKFAEDTADAFNLSKREALTASQAFANFGAAAGLSGKQLEQFTIPLVERAADAASYFGGSTSDAIEAFGAALRGEMEPIRKYGVLLDDATLRAKALEMGLISTTKNALTPQQKTLAAQALILERTSQVQGDVARTSDSMANKIKDAQQQFDDLQVSVGQTVAVGLSPLLDVMNKGLSAFNALPQPVKSSALVIGLVGTAALIAVPKIVAFKTAVADLGWTAARTKKGLAGLGKVAGVAAGIGALAAVVRSAGDTMYGMGENADELQGKLKALADGTLKDIDLGYKSAAGSTGSFNDALSTMVDNHWWDQIADGFAGMFGQDTTFDYAREAVDRVDQALAELVRGGNLTNAQDAFKVLQQRFVDAGGTAADFESQMNDYRNAVDAAKSPTGDLTTALGEQEDQIDATAEAWKAFRGALDKREAADNQTRSLKALSKSLEENGKSFKGNSDEALDNRDALRQAMDAVKNHVDALETGPAKAKAYRDGVAELRATLKKQGLSPKEINALLAPLLRMKEEIDAVKRKASTGVKLNIKPQITGRGQIIIAAASGGGRQILDVDYRAKGGPVVAGRPYIVGERGPELVVPKSSGTVIPNGALAAAGGTAQVNVYLDGRMVQTSLVDLKNAQGGRLNF